MVSKLYYFFKSYNSVVDVIKANKDIRGLIVPQSSLTSSPIWNLPLMYGLRLIAMVQFLVWTPRQPVVGLSNIPLAFFFVCVK